MAIIRCIYVQLFCVCLLLPSAVYADYSINMTKGVTPISRDIYDLHMTIFWICVAIGAVVFAVMFYAIIFHRKSQGAIAAQFHENAAGRRRPPHGRPDSKSATTDWPWRPRPRSSSPGATSGPACRRGTRLGPRRR